MIVGTLSMVPVPVQNGQLTKWTEQVAHNDGFDSHGGIRGQGPSVAIVPGNPGQRSPIQHVIYMVKYIVKDNRTYDQEFGSLGQGQRRSTQPKLHEVNLVDAPFAAQSEQQDLTKEDQINMQQFNLVTWASVKGANVPMPSPEHHVFPALLGDQAATAPTTGDGDDH